MYAVLRIDLQPVRAILSLWALIALWVLWCSPSHPLASKETLQWRQLRGVPLVAAGRDHEHNVEQMHLSTPEGERVVPIEIVDNMSTALGIAAQGLAATLSPAYVGALASAYGLVAKPISDPLVRQKVCLFSSTIRELSPAASGFSDFLLPWLLEWSSKLDRSVSYPIQRVI